MNNPTDDIRLEGDCSVFKATVEGRWLEPGLREITLRLVSPEPALPPAGVGVRWGMPLVDIAARWSPSAAFNRGLIPDWSGSHNRSAATQGAPVVTHHSADGRNRITFAASDALNAMQLRAGINEETATLQCEVRLFTEPAPPTNAYEVTIRIDTRDIPYYQSLDEVQRWWAAQPGYTPSAVPEVARRPMYSTWYSFHQHLDVGRVVRQCELARELGCEAVIVDDGWQTTDGSRGYAYCGDWEPLRIPDMRGFVDAVHGTGLKFLLWYAVPFIGKHAHAFKQFEGQFLRRDERMGAGVLDPRFSGVREYLIGLYERHMREWNLDGFKLDFVDLFSAENAPAQQPGDGRDIASVPAAADRLLSDIMQRLRSSNPEIMIEFRQSYVGPLMRKYGNIFRAGDCPNDLLSNRMRTIDIRLISGATATHSDMLMWHPDEPAESAALQLLAGFFSVPQISVLLDTLPAAHLSMLRFWLRFWNEHREVLLDGTLAPLSPAALYPVIHATAGDKRIIAIYDDNAVASLGGPGMGEIHMVNATRSGRLVVEVPAGVEGTASLQAYDCMGKQVESGPIALTPGVAVLRVPPAGLLSLRMSSR